MKQQKMIKADDKIAFLSIAWLFLQLYSIEVMGMPEVCGWFCTFEVFSIIGALIYLVPFYLIRKINEWGKED